ncbi:SO_0444 family Cu/Zn efflux transporter [Sulfurimonas sp.]|uniref:SO_0444 family Cu/Zn efflux transporter n=1 Tax=Sulfurimonas sp. TaxID=2022749 RepID=UPI002B489631|nr:SO_0444 family Cu/Zn efflux transporter [Sulfurimonas sp.]
MEILLKIFDNIMILSDAMSFYILIGLLIAGVLKQLIPDDFISSQLGANKISSVIKATIFGIPMPVCSCSVIPLAKSLQKEGASKGAVQSFLIATPITGADSIMATYSFFGWIFTIYRVVTAIIIAIVTGIFQNYVDKQDEKKEKAITFSVDKPSEVSDENTCETSCCSGDTHAKNSRFSIKESFNYAFNVLFKDIYVGLFIGLIIGGIFTSLLPKELLQPLFEYQFLTYIAILVISLPLYVCATASLPIAAAFLLSGMSSGAVFVFLSAGPATNSVTMGVVASMFGEKSLFIYLGVISVLSIFFGYVFDNFFYNLEVFDIHSHANEFSLLDTVSTVTMFTLMLYTFLKPKHDHSHEH